MNISNMLIDREKGPIIPLSPKEIEPRERKNTSLEKNIQLKKMSYAEENFI